MISSHPDHFSKKFRTVKYVEWRYDKIFPNRKVRPVGAKGLSNLSPKKEITRNYINSINKLINNKQTLMKLIN